MGGTLPIPNRRAEPPGAPDGLARSLLNHCARPVRRATLLTLADAGPLSVDVLATHVAARRDEVEPSAVEEDARSRAITSLYHNHLQNLSEAGLIERREGTTVALARTVDPERIHELCQAGEGAWDALETLLSGDRRERVVLALASSDGTASLTSLAESVAASEGANVDGPRQTAETVRTSLHHVDLPKLADVGVLEYDHETKRVELATVPAAYHRHVADVRPLTA